MSHIISTLTDAGHVDIHPEVLLCTYTATAVQEIAMQPSLSGLDGNAATITFRLEHTTADPLTLAYVRDIESRAKWAAADTRYGCRELGPVAMKTGEILNLYCASTNANDNTTHYSVDVINCLASDVIGILGTLVTETNPGDMADAFTAVFDTTTSPVDDIAGASADAVLDEAIGAHAGFLTTLATPALAADAVLDEALGAHAGFITTLATPALAADAVLDEALGVHTGFITTLATATNVTTSTSTTATNITNAVTAVNNHTDVDVAPLATTVQLTAAVAPLATPATVWDYLLIACTTPGTIAYKLYRYLVNGEIGGLP